MDVYPAVEFLHSLPPFLISIFLFLAGYFFLSVFALLFGESGIYCYIIIAILLANIQVLKVSQFSFFRGPVALGTELFATTFLATDILAEIFGKKSAQKAVLLGFLAMFTWAVFSFLTLGYQPVGLEQVQGDSFLFEMQGHLEAIFLPVPRFFIASIIAYLISQSFDIYAFSLLKRLCKSKMLWLRNNVSTILSSLLDNIVFSLFAFILLTPDPVTLSQLLITYILGSYVFRVVAAILDTPVIYIMRPILIKKASYSLKSYE